MNKGLTVLELDRLIGDRDHVPFLNSRNQMYRDMGMKENPPSRRAALKLMAENPNLIKRPVTVREHRVVLGFDERALKELTSD